MDSHQTTFARLFFLDAAAINYIKTKLRGPVAQRQGHDVSFSNDDAEAVKKLIRLYHKDGDEKKILFVFKPFDISHDHACILITDANLAAEALALKNVAKQQYALEIWPNCAVLVTEQMLAPSEGIFYHLPLVDVSNIFHQIVDSLNLYHTALQGDEKLDAISKRSTHELYPLPELFYAKGWRFKHFGYCSLLEPIDYGKLWITDAQSFETRTLQINLIKDISVTMYRAVDLKFFDKFRQSPDSSRLKLLAAAASLVCPNSIPSTANVIQKTRLESLLQSQTQNSSPDLTTILQEAAQRKTAFAQNHHNVAHQAQVAQPLVSSRFYQQPPQKQRVRTIYPNLQPQMGSHELLGQLLPPPTHQQPNENTMQIVFPQTPTVSSSQLARLSTSTMRSNSLTDSILNSRNDNNDIELLHFSTAWRRKMLTKISGENFSVSYSNGCRSIEVFHKTKRRVTAKFARKVLEVLENEFKIEELETSIRLPKCDNATTDDDLGPLNFLNDYKIANMFSEPSSTTLEVQHRNLIANYISTTGTNLNTMAPADDKMTGNGNEASRKRKSEAENGQIMSAIGTKKVKLSPCTTTSELSEDTDSTSEDGDTQQNENNEQAAHKIGQDVALDLTNKRSEHLMHSF